MKKNVAAGLFLLVAAKVFTVPAIANEPHSELLLDPDLKCFLTTSVGLLINLNQMCKRIVPASATLKPSQPIAASSNPETDTKMGAVKPVGTPTIQKAESGYWMVSCQIMNNTNQPVNSVLVTFSIDPSADGEGIPNTNSTYIQPLTIPAGESGSLEMLVKESGKVQILAVEWQWIDGTPGTFHPSLP
ncbi:MAG: hypothetical protein KME16_15520 [Scytolyngbya sp. HA4215-MV1]|jgi:hypothetical protein|nr:hypothetical protein [Scytolyngbya sp. HA4215-MV1]